MKDSQYLTHDLGARNDAKIVELQMELGCEGIGIYWCLIEMLWEQGGYLPCKYKALAFSIRGTQEDTVRRVVEDFGLFVIDGDEFYSQSALDRLVHKKNQSEAKAAGGRKGAATTNNKKSTMPQDSSDIAATMPQDSSEYAEAEPKQSERTFKALAYDIHALLAGIHSFVGFFAAVIHYIVELLNNGVL
ncbi:MAG: DUF4373 domain-containing protein, partial [Bacteroidales bacterium]|nr:DUF4373 domain-containing protein [Bacteroidales bacterium]